MLPEGHDDFGSGMSSFAYLKAFPVECVKIDGMFVQDMVRDPVDAATVRSINEIGKMMGIQVVAEYVDNAEILAALREIGVAYVQGDHLGTAVEMALPCR